MTAVDGSLLTLRLDDVKSLEDSLVGELLCHVALQTEEYCLKMCSVLQRVGRGCISRQLLLQKAVLRIQRAVRVHQARGMLRAKRVEACYYRRKAEAAETALHRKADLAARVLQRRWRGVDASACNAATQRGGEERKAAVMTEGQEGEVSPPCSESWDGEGEGGQSEGGGMEEEEGTSPRVWEIDREEGEEQGEGSAPEGGGGDTGRRSVADLSETVCDAPGACGDEGVFELRVIPQSRVHGRGKGRWIVDTKDLVPDSLLRPIYLCEAGRDVDPPVGVYFVDSSERVVDVAGDVVFAADSGLCSTVGRVNGVTLLLATAQKTGFHMFTITALKAGKTVASVQVPLDVYPQCPRKIDPATWYSLFCLERTYHDGGGAPTSALLSGYSKLMEMPTYHELQLHTADKLQWRWFREVQEMFANDPLLTLPPAVPPPLPALEIPLSTSADSRQGRQGDHPNRYPLKPLSKLHYTDYLPKGFKTDLQIYREAKGAKDAPPPLRTRPTAIGDIPWIPAGRNRPKPFHEALHRLARTPAQLPKRTPAPAPTLPPMVAYPKPLPPDSIASQ